MSSDDPTAIRHRLTALRAEERELAQKISDFSDGVTRDELALTRMKKRHEIVVEMIAYLEDKLIPDLDA